MPRGRGYKGKSKGYSPPKPKRARGIDEGSPWDEPKFPTPAPAPTSKVSSSNPADVLAYMKPLGLNYRQAQRYIDATGGGQATPEQWARIVGGRPADPSAMAGLQYGYKDMSGPRFSSVASALMPYLASEEQKAVRDYLADTYPDEYGDIEDGEFIPLPTSEARMQFYNAQRAKQAKEALGNLGVEGGAGIDFLNSVISTLEKYGDTPLTRAQRAEFSKEANRLIEDAESNPELEAYSSLADLFVNPSARLGAITQNKKLFG